MNKDLLTIEGLYWQYDDLHVLSDVTLGITKGGFTSLIGPNGSGKTTLFKIIAGLLKPKVGTVQFDGKVVQSLGKKQLARIIAHVPQEIHVDYQFSALDIVLMGRNPHLGRFRSEGEKDYEICRMAMEATDCWVLKDRFISALSGGERQRVIIARALAQEPKLILLDEPTSHLDLHHQIEILNLIRRLNVDNGLTVMAVLHDINLATHFSDTILMLKDGRITGCGTPAEVITQENIKRTYNMNVMVMKNPMTDLPFILPIDEEQNICLPRASVN